MPRGTASSFASLFKQQRLPAIQPLTHPFHVTIWLLAAALLFIPLGVIVVLSGKLAKELTFRYDDINRCTTQSNQGAFTYTGNGQELKTGCITHVSFRLNTTLKAPIYLYYGLTGFYQNHRKLSDSKSQEQLQGAPVSRRDLKRLAPLMYPGELSGDEHTPIEVNGRTYHYRDFVYSPGGLLPWSMFNDTFTLYRVESSSSSVDEDGIPREPVRFLICNDSAFSKFTNEPLEVQTKSSSVVVKTTGGKGCRKKGITWKTDVNHCFKPIFFPSGKGDHDDSLIWSAPRYLYRTEDQPFVKDQSLYNVTSNDTFFNEGWYAGELGHAIPVSTDEDLMVWLRLAPSPKFRKLRRIIEEDMEPGQYLMEIGEHYDSVSFGGEKSFTFATVSYLGGRNIFLAKLCLTIGIASLLIIFVFLLLRRNYEIQVQQELAYLHQIN
ncbi:unnamed protein product [Phytomonas sp. EM1]|nr:unnamed protein product [Phytomonas sp. EM1]|eukprot:CCW62175.1 unnamed protein product [Phytomonas sp. isolate EM1]